jgi:hypothetical protein
MRRTFAVLRSLGARSGSSEVVQKNSASRVAAARGFALFHHRSTEIKARHSRNQQEHVESPFSPREKVPKGDEGRGAREDPS